MMIHNYFKPFSDAYLLHKSVLRNSMQEELYSKSMLIQAKCINKKRTNCMIFQLEKKGNSNNTDRPSNSKDLDK